MADPNNPEATPRQIGTLEVSDPVHAECKNPEVYFREMISIDIGRCQSVSMSEIRLGVDVSFEAVEVNIAGQPYELSLAAGTLRLEHENASVVEGSKYHHVLKAGTIEASQSTTDRSERGRELGIEGKTSSGGRPSVGATGSWNSKKHREYESIGKVEHQITLVRPAGQDSWSFGGPDGNPLLATRDLRGPVISSFTAEDAMKPLCKLTAKEENKPVSGRITILASTTDFRLFAKHQPLLRLKAPQAAFDSIGPGLADDAKRFAKRANEASQSLKERVAVMALLMPERRAASSSQIRLAEREFAFLPVDPMENRPE